MEELNARGCALLCQAIIVSAINNNEADFLETELGDTCCHLATRFNNYDIRSIKARKRPVVVTKQRYNFQKLSYEAKIFPLSELAQKYKTSEQKLKIALSKHHIEWIGKRNYAKEFNHSFIYVNKNTIQYEFQF